jgi:hypothetical protein
MHDDLRIRVRSLPSAAAVVCSHDQLACRSQLQELDAIAERIESVAPIKGAQSLLVSCWM